MPDLKVTWIAPVIADLPQLAWLNELGRIQRIAHVQVTTLTGGDILLDDVAVALGTPCDVLVWSGHGAPGGLLLPDRSLVRTKWLAIRIARGSRPRLVILASCGSQLRDENLRSLAEAICREGINVVGFPADASDAAAGKFTVECIRALAVNATIVQAFDVALESIASGDTDTASGVFLTPGIANLPFSLADTLQRLADALGRIEVVLGASTPAAAANTAGANTAGGIQSLSRGASTTRGEPVARSGHVRGLEG